MKLDLDYVKLLLNTINDCDDDRVSLNYLFETMQISSKNNELAEKKLRHHLFILYQAQFIETSADNLGFKETVSGNLICMGNAKYWPTMSGYKLLESMNNDTLFNKILSGLSNFGIETLKQIPAIAIDIVKAEVIRRIVQ
jgi:hypothetical protein